MQQRRAAVRLTLLNACVTAQRLKVRPIGALFGAKTQDIKNGFVMFVFLEWLN